MNSEQIIDDIDVILENYCAKHWNTEEVFKAKSAINTYTTNKIIEELVNFRNADFDPNKTLAQTLMYVDARIAELKTLNHRKDE